MTITTDSGELSINLFKSLCDKKPIFFKTKSSTIIFGILKSKEFLGIGSCSLCNNPQWVSIYPPSYKNNLPLPSVPSQYKKSSFISTPSQTLVENLRLKLTFSKESCNNLIKTPKTSQQENNINFTQNTIATPLVNNSISMDLKHKNAKSLASLLMTSPLSSSQHHKHKIHNLNNVQKTLKNYFNNITPSKQQNKNIL